MAPHVRGRHGVTVRVRAKRCHACAGAGSWQRHRTWGIGATPTVIAAMTVVRLVMINVLIIIMRLRDTATAATGHEGVNSL